MPLRMPKESMRNEGLKEGGQEIWYRELALDLSRIPSFYCESYDPVAAMMLQNKERENMKDNR